MRLLRFAQKWARKIIALCIVISLFNQGCDELKKEKNPIARQAKASHMDSKAGDEQRERVQGNEIVVLLHKENLIKDKGNFSFRITNTALFINGVKQLRQLHKKMIQEFVKNPSNRLSYTYSTSTNAD